MPLTVELDDGQRWRVCSSHARVSVKVRFTELPREGVEPQPKILYEKRTTRMLRFPVRSKARMLKRRPEEEDWTDDVTVEAGLFLSRRIIFEVGKRYDPPHAASIWLIPKASAVLAAALLVACLVTLAWTTAATLSTLHLNFSYSDAVTGIGGLTLLGLAGKVIRSVTDQVRRHGVPLYGVGYMLGRTLAACVMVSLTLGLVMPQCVTTVINDTEAEIELTIPGSPDRVSLRPHQRLTFLGNPSGVRDKVKDGFSKPDRFCAGRADATSMFDNVIEVLAETREPCLASLGQDGSVSTDAPLWGWLSPSSIPLGCTSSPWDGVGVGQVELETRVGTYPSPHSDGLMVDYNEACEPVKGAHVQVKLDPPPGENFLAAYRIWHPFTVEQVEQTARVAVESEPGQALRLVMSDEGEDGAEADKPRRPHLVVDALQDGGISALMPTPFAASVSELSVLLGGPSGDLERARVLEQGALRCVRHDSALQSYFRLVPVPTYGNRARVLELRARSTALPAWESQWNNLRPSSATGAAPRLCVVAPSPDGVATTPAIPPRSLSLSVAVSFPRFGESVSLRVPASYAARVIEVSAQSPAGGVMRGSLTCVPTGPDAFVAYEIGPLWIEGAKGGSVNDVSELQIDSKAPAPTAAELVQLEEDRSRCRREPPSCSAEGCEQLAKRVEVCLEAAQGKYDNQRQKIVRKYEWRSQWSTDGNEGASNAAGWFPPWVCRPVLPDDAGCLGCNREVSTPNQVTGDVRTRRWNDASVFLSEGRARLQVSGRKPCYLHFETGRPQNTCPRSCEKLKAPQLKRYNRDFGTSCPAIHLCDPKKQC
ncbi:MAG: hypothetical protein AAF799_15420 [Myxococcota bacterium]